MSNRITLNNSEIAELTSVIRGLLSDNASHICIKGVTLYKSEEYSSSHTKEFNIKIEEISISRQPDRPPYNDSIR